MCDVAVVFALGIEAGGLEDLLKSRRVIRGHGFRVTQGRLQHRNVAVIVSGLGGPAAASATQALLDGHHPACVISAGFAGGLDPRLARLDLLLANALVDMQREPVPIDFPAELATLCTAPRVHVGRLLSVGRVVSAPEEKRRLGHEYHALAVDMETFSVAAVCRERQVRFLAVRVLSDAVDDRLPSEVEALLLQKTTAGRLGAVVGSILRHPGSVKPLWTLHQNAIAASDRLAAFLALVIERLEAASPQLPRP